MLNSGDLKNSRNFIEFIDIFLTMYRVKKKEVLPKLTVSTYLYWCLFQLLKFVPTQEEALLLKEHEREINKMARADRFLYDLSK